MNRVVVLAMHRTQDLAFEQQFLFICLVVAIRVSQQKDPVRCGDDGLVAEHAYPMHAIDVRVLVKHLCLVGPAIAIAVLQDQYAVAFLAVLLAVIDRLSYPNATAVVDVYAGRVGQLLGGGKQLDGQALGHGQLGVGLLGKTKNQGDAPKKR